MKLTAEELEEVGLIAIVRTKREIPLQSVAEALARGGIRVMEITLNTPGALDSIRRLRVALGDAIHVGAGTILEPEDARRAIAAGAEFIVTPTVQTDTIAVCRERRIPIVCGAMTPTEALTVHRAGADFIKLFPVEMLGADYIRALLAPLPFLKIMPTGGVNKETLAGFIQAGCVGVALGSSLVSQDILRDQDWERLTTLSREYVELLRNVRNSSRST